MNFSANYFCTLAIIFSQHISFSFGLVSVSHVGDFMEFYVSLHAACENVTNGDNAMREITSSFANCTNKINENEPKDLFGAITAICKNREEYFNCWDTMKIETMRKCGDDKEHMLPILYRNTVFSFCEKDNGAIKLDNMRQAFKIIQPVGKQDKCSEAVGSHWLDKCKDSLSSFISPDHCKRHEAIDKCVGKITCGGFRGAPLIRQMYSDGRPLLRCKG